MKKLCWLLVASVVALLAVVALLTPRAQDFALELVVSKEQYEGHPARYWVRALDSPDDEVRGQAIHAVGALGPEAGEAVPALSKILLDSPSSKDRSEAAFALSKMVPASRTAVPALAQALQDNNLLVRMNAATALALLGALPREKDEAPATRPAIPALLKALKDKNNQTNLQRFYATIQGEVALALGRASAGTAEAVPALMDALEAIRNDQTLPQIKTIKTEAGQMAEGGDNAHHPNTPIRAKMALARALGEVGPEGRQAVPLLVKMLREDQTSDFKIDAARALGAIGPEAGSAVPLLRQMLQQKDQNPEFKVAAEEALQKIEGKAAAAK